MRGLIKIEENEFFDLVQYFSGGRRILGTAAKRQFIVDMIEALEKSCPYNIVKIDENTYSFKGYGEGDE
jgi:hypothetical protein